MSKEYDASDYIIPSVNIENLEGFELPFPRPRWQRRLAWLVPSWGRPQYRFVPVDELPPADPSLVVKMSESGVFFIEPPEAG